MLLILLYSILIFILQLIYNTLGDYMNIQDNTYFENCDFSHEDLTDTTLNSKTFISCNFKDCDMTELQISNSRFESCDFTLADLKSIYCLNCAFTKTVRKSRKIFHKS